MLSVSELNVAIQGVSILQNANLNIPEGSMVGLVGHNGAGKTTFMRSIMGLIDAQGGTVMFENQNLLSAKSHDRAKRGIGYLPEDRRLIGNFTVEENIMVPLWATGKEHEAHRLEWVYQIMPEIARYRSRQAMTLSGGQQKLVALGRALVCGSKLLLLDEPFEGVAPALAGRLVEVIAALKGKSISVLISESDFTHTKNLVDEVFSIERGKIKLREETDEQPLIENA